MLQNNDTRPQLSAETFWLSAALVDRSLACSYGGGAGEEGSRKGGPRGRRGTMQTVRRGKRGRDDEAGGGDGGELIVPKERLQLVGW